MAKANFVSLRVYPLAEQVADEVWQLVLQWDHFAKDTVGKQLVRASDSIGANIAEGAGRGTFIDNRRFITIARGSLHETTHWLRRAYKRDLLSKPQAQNLKKIMDELSILKRIPKINHPKISHRNNN